MGFFTKLAARIILNGAALYIAETYFPGFLLSGGLETLILGALVLALLNTFLRPILMLATLPLRWLTFGLFNIVIYGFILWLADLFLTQITITDYTTLFWASIIVAIANAFF
jgi:putative membrane protein